MSASSSGADNADEGSAPGSLWNPVSHVDVLAWRRETCCMSRCAVVRLARMEETSCKGNVVAAGAERVLGEAAGQPVSLDQLQRGTPVFEGTGRKPRFLAVEEPDFCEVALGASSVLVHGKNVSRQSCRRPSRGMFICRG
jgi:hypothetical protein